MFVDYYCVLEISLNSNSTEIKAAYKKQAIKWHPDKNKVDTTERMQLINEAKLILLNEDARKKYDLEYLRFTNTKQSSQFQNVNETNNHYSNKGSKNKHVYDDYIIQDSLLIFLINEARAKAKKIIEETIELSEVGGKAALQEIKFGIGCWLVFLLIIGLIFIIHTLIN